MLAVLGGLNHFSVRRLQQTWNVVEKSKKEVLVGGAYRKWVEFAEGGVELTESGWSLQKVGRACRNLCGACRKGWSL